MQNSHHNDSFLITTRNKVERLREIKTHGEKKFTEWERGRGIERESERKRNYEGHRLGVERETRKKGMLKGERADSKREGIVVKQEEMCECLRVWKHGPTLVKER